MTKDLTIKPRLKRELTKNGRSISARLTESEYVEWRKLGKGKWLRSFLKDSRFEREKQLGDKHD